MSVRKIWRGNLDLKVDIWPSQRVLWLNCHRFVANRPDRFSTVGKGAPISPNASIEYETVQLRGGELATTLRSQIRLARMKLMRDGGHPPVLVTLAAEPNASADAYRTSISRTMKRVDIEHRPIDLPSGAGDKELEQALAELNADPGVTGVLVLMPLPARMDTGIVSEQLNPLKDVDGVTVVNAGRLHLGLPCLAPSTPNGGVALLDHYGIQIKGARAVVIGRSNVVGRPLAALLQRRDATVTVCHSSTRDVESYTREADIVALAIGKPGFLTRELIRPGATVLDFGINVLGERITGDADFEGLQGIAGAITPVPGGTGPITALMLARNTIAAGIAGLHNDLDSIPPFERWQSAEPMETEA
jgi:methylenetetrahydrofolate dehydrogenase (NADP+)/methenyltetrahydrofolate cyclohydrolase